MRIAALFVLATIMGLAAGYWTSQWLNTSPDTVSSIAISNGDVVDFELPNPEGKRYSLSKWRGKVVLVNFWASWCAPCREEIPLLVDVQKRYGRQGLQIIGVAIDERDSVVDFRNDIPMNYPTLIGQDDAIAVMERLGNRFGTLPFSVTINRTGQVATRKLGVYQRPELESLLKSMLPVVE